MAYQITDQETERIAELGLHYRTDQGMGFWGRTRSAADIITVAGETGVSALSLNEMAYEAGDRSEMERDRIADLLKKS